jgi:hypothetical protein
VKFRFICRNIQQRLHLDYRSLNRYNISGLVVHIMLSLITVAANKDATESRVAKQYFEGFTVATMSLLTVTQFCVTNEYGYVPFIVITIRLFHHWWIIIGFAARVSNMTGAISGAGTAHPSGILEFTPEFYVTWVRVITKLPNSEQSYKGKVKTHNYINRQNQSTTGKLWKP